MGLKAVNLEIEFTDEQFQRLALAAHEQGLTFQQLASNILRDRLHEAELDEKDQKIADLEAKAEFEVGDEVQVRESSGSGMKTPLAGKKGRVKKFTYGGMNGWDIVVTFPKGEAGSMEMHMNFSKEELLLLRKAHLIDER